MTNSETTKRKLEAIKEAEEKIQERKALLERTQRATAKLEKHLRKEAKDEIEALRDELNKEVISFAHKIREGKRVIDSLVVIRKNGKENKELTKMCKDILKARYVEGEKWEVIAVNMGYNLRYIYKLHGLALTSVCQKVTKAPSVFRPVCNQ